MIRLIDADPVQKKWALVIQGPVPTIEGYKRNPHLFNTIPHGLYEIDCDIKNIQSHDNGMRLWLDGYGQSQGRTVKVLCSHVELLKQIAAQNLWYNEDIVSMRGRFDKRGSEILFILGAE